MLSYYSHPKHRGSILLDVYIYILYCSYSLTYTAHFKPTSSKTCVGVDKVSLSTWCNNCIEFVRSRRQSSAFHREPRTCNLWFCGEGHFAILPWSPWQQRSDYALWKHSRHFFVLCYIPHCLEVWKGNKTRDGWKCYHHPHERVRHTLDTGNWCILSCLL